VEICYFDLVHDYGRLQRSAFKSMRPVKTDRCRLGRLLILR
jgi:hypothetical protein